MSRPDRTLLPATLALVAVVVLAAALSTPWAWSPPVFGDVSLPDLAPPDDPTPPPEQTEPPAAPTVRSRTVETILVTVLTLTVLAAFLALALALYNSALVRRRPRHHPDDDPLEPGDTLTTDQSTTLKHAVDHAHSTLHTPALPPRDAIVAAWVVLEDAAATAGTRRHPAQTPTEFTAAVLERTPAHPDDVTHLRSLYQHARFTTRPVHPDDVTSARHALARIARALGPDDTATTESATPDGTHR